jgi:glycosyltransferase involved in cell wall biosynthesis
MKILLIASRIPYPLRDGGAIATFNQFKGYATLGHAVRMFALNTRKHFVDEETIQRELEPYGAVETYAINTDIRWQDALLNLFSRRSYNIDRFDAPGFHNLLAHHLESHQYDLVQFEGLFTAPYVHAVRANSRARLVLRQHNVEYRIWQKQAAAEPNPIKRAYLKLLARRLQRYETSVLQAFDGIAAITADDAAILQEHAPNVPVCAVPAGIALPELKPEGNSHALYHIGSMEWMPNQSAVQRLLQRIWPLVLEKNQKSTLHLAGKAMAQATLPELPPMVFNDGEVADAALWSEPFGILCVPLMAASGVRMKTLEALAEGKWVVTTSVGAAGLPLEHEKHCLIADGDAEFAAAVLRLQTDAQLREKLRRHGLELAAQYSIENSCRRMLQWIETLPFRSSPK